MHKEFNMSLTGELNYFCLGFQIKQTKDDIYIHQTQYKKELLKRFKFEKSKSKVTPMSTLIKFTSDDKGTDVKITIYEVMIFYLNLCG